ncbi:MAG TPA: hypothetical protein V6D17_20735 [Candidatus Obscuribacterales bacterium]
MRSRTVLLHNAKQQNRSKFAGELLKAPPFWAVVIFACFNVTLYLWQPRINVAPADLPVRTSWEWWRARSFESEKVAPDIVLLGSSLIMIPATLADVEFLQQDIDAVRHTRVVSLERRLQNEGAGNQIKSFNFALPGAMISDDYMVTRALLSGERKPRVLVLGLSLRDFIDNGVEAATATPAFQYFRHYFPLKDIETLVAPTLPGRFEFLQSQILFLWDKRLQLQALASGALRCLASGMLGTSNMSAAQAAFLKASLTSAADEGEDMTSATCVREGAFIHRPNTVRPFKDNTREYRKRFRTAHQELFNNQVVFLERLLALANERGIEVVIVNMPLTERNMKLMPKGSYAQYLSALQSASIKYGARVFDMNDQRSFLVSDFLDSVHLNASGSKKFVDKLAAYMSRDGAVRSALLSPAEQPTNECSRPNVTM